MADGGHLEKLKHGHMPILAIVGPMGTQFGKFEFSKIQDGGWPPF